MRDDHEIPLRLIWKWNLPAPWTIFQWPSLEGVSLAFLSVSVTEVHKLVFFIRLPSPMTMPAGKGEGLSRSGRQSEATQGADAKWKWHHHVDDALVFRQNSMIESASYHRVLPKHDGVTSVWNQHTVFGGGTGAPKIWGSPALAWGLATLILQS